MKLGCLSSISHRERVRGSKRQTPLISPPPPGPFAKLRTGFSLREKEPTSAAPQRKSQSLSFNGASAYLHAIAQLGGDEGKGDQR
jgi:hypothetical protein